MIGVLSLLTVLEGDHKSVAWSGWKVSPSKRFVLVKSNLTRVKVVPHTSLGLVLTFPGSWVPEVSSFKTRKLLHPRFRD